MTPSVEIPLWIAGSVMSVVGACILWLVTTTLKTKEDVAVLEQRMERVGKDLDELLDLSRKNSDNIHRIQLVLAACRGVPVLDPLLDPIPGTAGDAE